MKQEQAILVVSFGTSYRETREKTIEAIESDLRLAFPDYEFRRAFTSPTIRRILKSRDGIEIDDVAGACRRLAEEGYRRVIVQPTYVICGFEYDATLQTVESFRDSFAEISCKDALLTTEEDYRETLQAVLAAMEPYRGADTAFVLMGHGTEHAANASYQRLQRMLDEMGRQDVRIGTVEAPEVLDELIGSVQALGVSKVVLSPFMVVAGDHALNDMSGPQKTSWKSRFEQAGFTVSCILRGLGEYPAIRSIYVKHARRNPA